MDVTLYKNNSENNVIGKNLTYLSSITAVNKEIISVENPTIVLSYSGDMNNVNYIYIEDFDRYYFVNEVRGLNGNMYQIACNVDVLESFKNDIKQLTAVIDKQENVALANKYFNDGSFNVSCKEMLQTFNFPEGFNNNGEFILIACGG